MVVRQSIRLQALELLLIPLVQVFLLNMFVLLVEVLADLPIMVVEEVLEVILLDQQHVPQVQLQ
jgi:hypothetical protein